ncbi:hypothetical protein [Gemmatimonas sp.]
MMNWILLVMATVAAVVLAMLIGGLLSPRVRVASKSLVCDVEPERLFQLLRAADGPPRWCASLPTMRVQEEAPPHGVTFMLFDDDGGARGMWRITVQRDEERTVATISEQVTVPNPILRFVRSFGGNGARLQTFLEAVAGELSVPPRIRDGAP